MRQLWRKLAAKVWQFSKSRSASRPRPQGRLHLEALEERALMSASAAAPAVGVFGESSAPTGWTATQIRATFGFDQIKVNIPGVATINGDGLGQTIAIVDAFTDPNIQADLDTFDQAMGLGGLTLDIENPFGAPGLAPTPTSPTAQAWGEETALDVEWAHAMAPQANIMLVEVAPASLDSAANWAAGQPGVSVVSMSFGEIPPTDSTGKATGPGETPPSSTSPGDPGLDSLFTTPAGHQGVTFVASSGDLGAVQYPATSPNVLSVGGTSMTADASGNPDVLTEVAWSGSGGGFSTIESEPPYQNGVQMSGKRSNPDVAYLAVNFSVCDSYDTDMGTQWINMQGTSAGAPQWAALIAVANEVRVLQNGLSTLDGANQTLKMLYTLPSRDFQDITSGTTVQGLSAAPGYDEVTGLGRPWADLIAADLGNATTPALVKIGGLSSPVMLDGQTLLSASSERYFHLKPGTHTLKQGPGESASFQVAADGTISYDPALEGVLQGAGGTVLTVAGRTMTIDASPLSIPALELNGNSSLIVKNTAPFTFTGLPGTLNLWDSAGSGAKVQFTLGADGNIGYNLPLSEQGVLAGAGTSTLLVNGRTMSVDLRALSTPYLALDTRVIVHNTAPFSFTGLPATYTLWDSGGSGGKVQFTLGDDGNVGYDQPTATAGILAGTGTSTLLVLGEAVQIDARALAASTRTFSVGNIVGLSTATVQTIHVLPGTLTLRAGTRQVGFTVNNLDQVALSSGIEALINANLINELVLLAGV